MNIVKISQHTIKYNLSMIRPISVQLMLSCKRGGIVT